MLSNVTERIVVRDHAQFSTSPSPVSRRPAPFLQFLNPHRRFLDGTAPVPIRPPFQNEVRGRASTSCRSIIAGRTATSSAP
jgi:hypothetical protein